MDWSVARGDSRAVAIARALVEITPQSGWTASALREASWRATGDPEAWRALFPKGSRDAIWLISEVSDASMRASLAGRIGVRVSDAIAERLEQNADLKPFVRQVSLFDFAHPLQAFARMQTTARAMLACAGAERAGWLRRTGVNLIYSLTILGWLFDRSHADRASKAFARRGLGFLRLD